MSFKFKITRAEAGKLLGDLVRYLPLKIEYQEFNLVVSSKGVSLEPLIEEVIKTLTDEEILVEVEL